MNRNSHVGLFNSYQMNFVYDTVAKMSEMRSPKDWYALRDGIRICTGCGESIHSEDITDARCAAHENLHNAVFEVGALQSVANDKQAKFDAWGRDTEQLGQTLAREGASIIALRAAIEKANKRIARAQQEYNARWSGPQQSQVEADYTDSTMSLIDSRRRLHTAYHAWTHANFDRAVDQTLAATPFTDQPPASEESDDESGDDPTEQSGEEWTDQSESEDKENEQPARGGRTYTTPRGQRGLTAKPEAGGATGVGRVQDWLSGTQDTASETGSDSLGTGGSGWSSATSFSPPRSRERPGDRGDLESPTLNRRGQAAPEESDKKRGAPTKRQRTARSRGCRHEPYHHR